MAWIPACRRAARILQFVGVAMVSTAPGVMAQKALLLAATPATISFVANNPGSNITGSASASVTFSMTTTGHNPWTLKVGSAATTFTGCATVPTSAVSVTCSSATIAGNAHGATAACSVGSFTTLPGSIPGLQVANGLEPSSFSLGVPFTIILNYRLADSWAFVANTCPLTLTYTVTAP